MNGIDPMDATIRSLRDAARSLCEKLQDECNRAHWKPEFIHLVEEIERSEIVLPPIGRVTTLKPSREL